MHPACPPALLRQTRDTMTDTDFQLTPPDLPPATPIAHVFGQPVLEVPQDLFIPPDALQLILESFEGPLDLLLYLIRKQNLDVLNVPMAEVTAQYMGYIDAMRDGRLELAAEYLLMAALLIEIKSEEHTSELQSHHDLVCRLLLEKKKQQNNKKKKKKKKKIIISKILN